MVIVAIVLLVAAVPNSQRTSMGMAKSAGEMWPAIGDRRPALPDWLFVRLQHAAAFLSGLAFGLSFLVLSTQDQLPVWFDWHQGQDLTAVSIAAGLVVVTIELVVEPIRPRFRRAAELHNCIAAALLLSGFLGGTIVMAAAVHLATGFASN